MRLRRLRPEFWCRPVRVVSPRVVVPTPESVRSRVSPPRSRGHRGSVDSSSRRDRAERHRRGRRLPVGLPNAFACDPGVGVAVELADELAAVAVAELDREHRSRRAQAGSSATDSTAAATASSTPRSTESRSHRRAPPRSPRLPRTQTGRRKEPPRSHPLPQTTPRPCRLSDPESEPGLDIGATLAQPRLLGLDGAAQPFTDGSEGALLVSVRIYISGLPGPVGVGARRRRRPSGSRRGRRRVGRHRSRR